MNVLALAVRNALRNVRRTMLTAGTLVVSVSLFVFIGAWLTGVFDSILRDSADHVGHVRLADPDFVQREQLMPLYSNIRDVAPVVASLEQVPGVVAAHPVIRSGVAVSAGEELGDVFGLATGAPVAWFSDVMGLQSKLVGGTWFTDPQTQLILGVRLAHKAGAEVGDEVLLLGQTQDGSISPIKGTLVGVVQAGNPLVDQGAFVPLERMQWLADIPGGAVEVLVYGEDPMDAGGLADAVRSSPAAEGLEVQAWLEREPFNLLGSITGVVQGMFGAILVFITGLAVLNTMMMSVLERTNEIGVLRAMGLTRTSAVALFVLEAMVIALIGSTIGALLGSVPVLWFELPGNGITIGEEITQNVGSDMAFSTTMYPDLQLKHGVQGIALGLITAILGAAIPAIRAALIQPVDAMRSRRT